MAEKTHNDICKGFYKHPGFNVQIGETQTIFPMEERLCPCGYLFPLNNGELVAGGRRTGYPGVLRPNDPLPVWKRSKDGGHTWYDAPPWPSYNAFQYPDGEIIQFLPELLQLTGRPGEFGNQLFRSTDNGCTLHEETVYLVDMPELAARKDRLGKDCADAYLDHAFVRLTDGSVLATVLGRFVNDKKSKGRTFIVRSTDHGKTWHYWSTVAFDLIENKERRLGGFSEPDLLQLANGDLLCFMRTGGWYDGVYTPLYMSRSADGGKTWCNADPIADRGVYPRAALTDSGVIGLIYGRPGHWLAFSADDANSWKGHVCLYHSRDPHDCGGYDWLVQVAPNTLLAAYAHTDANDCMQSMILGTFITVERT